MIYSMHKPVSTGFLLFLLLCFAGDAHCVQVNSVVGLINAVENANSGGDRDIRVADGVYDLSGVALQITANGVSIRSGSGTRGGVVLDSHYIEGATSGIFRILSSNVTIADMTLKRPYYHAVHISPPGDGAIEHVVLDNLHIIDPGEQAVKINAGAPGGSINNGIIKNCLIELTDAGRANLTYSGYPCYTGGIDGHYSNNWTIQDNEIRGFWCSDGLSEHGIHFWRNSSNILVERNRIIDCDRGIGFGLGADGNSGGIIRNNMISHGPDHGFADVGIGIESTPNVQVYNNTIYHQHDYSAVEYRFAATANAYIANNLTNRSITQRDGAAGTERNNIQTALASWFVDTLAGDLHLTTSIVGVVDQGVAIAGLTDDFDRGTRPYGSGYDIGADEFGAGPPSPPNPNPPPKMSIAPILYLLWERSGR